MDNPRRPLTVAQQEIWAYTTLLGTDRRYLISGYVQLHGRIEPDLFEQALRNVVARSETLRVRLDHTGPEPMQVLEDCTGFPLRRGDFGTAPDPLAAALAALDPELARPYDLTTAPLFDHYLFDLGAAGHLWGIKAHHVIFDGGASLALIREVARVYTALLAGQPAPTEIHDTVAGFVDADLRYRASRRFTEDRAFWAERLAGLPDAPMFTHPPARQRASGPIRRSGTPTAHDWSQFCGAAEAFEVDWSALLAATIALLLHADTGARTVVLGVSVPAKRSWRALGMTSNVVGLRLTVDPTASIRALAQHAQAEFRKLLRHQHYRRFDLLADGTAPGGEHRVIGPVLNILPIPTELRFGDVRATLTPVSTGGTEVFGIGVYAGAGAPRIDFDTAADRCDPEALARLHEHFLSTLNAVAAATPATPIARLVQLEPPADRAPYDDPRGVTNRGVAAAFADIAREFPDRNAIWYEGEHLTYRELDARAAGFARHLADHHDVRLGTPVAVRLPRCPELVVALLALMRLGAICVPLHEQDPPERVEWMLRHTGSRLVLDDIETVRAAPPADAARRPAVPAEAVAWLMFTSGSTGEPKGVQVTHRAVVTRAIDRIAAGPEYARMLMHSPYAWDMVVWELWMPLLQGHTAVLATPARLSAADFRHVLRAGAVTAMLCPAGLFQVLVEDIPESLAALRTISSAGDVLAPDTVRAIRAHAPEFEVVNIYGPVEATAYATAYTIPPGQIDDAAFPVGRAVDHTEVLVLDALLRPVPPGLVGGIYLTGAGLAQGYLGMPGRTASWFTADPFGAPGSRMYRTGDYGSWGPDGELRFLGRGDRQVKVNGIRVEPGEIEHVLRAQPGVTAAVVTAHRMAAGKTLIAHIVADTAIDTAALRDRLTARLPSYLLPAVIVQIPALPLTVNGKIDRRALTLPEPAAVRPPRTPRQQVLAGLFAAAVGAPRVGLDDDFFELGGNSLAAIRLAAAASRELGRTVTLRDLLEAPTVAALEQLLDDRVGDRTVRPVLLPARRPEVIPLSPVQHRLWTVNYLSEGTADYLMPAALELRGPFDTAALRSAVDDIVRRHEILRTILPFTPTGPVQRILDFRAEDVDYREILVEPPELDAALATEVSRGFRLMNEPPWRIRLFRISPVHHIVLVVIHHCAGDAESLGALLNELRYAYLARAANQEPQWPTAAFQYADYTLMSRESLGAQDDPGSRLAEQARYWRTTLADLPSEPPLPVDHPRAQGSPAAILAFDIDADAHTRLLAAARRCGATAYSVLHAALVCALAQRGAGPDLVIGTALSGRDRAELDTMLGCAVDIVLIRTDHAAAFTHRDLVRQVRDRILEAHEHREFPYERLIPAGATALPQIVTTFFRDVATTGSTGDLEFRLRELPAQRAEFEVLLQAREVIGPTGRPGGIRAEFRYAATLWAPETIAALATDLSAALAAICADLDAAPGGPLASAAQGGGERGIEG
ncbi:non-ribosomal peptide synthetase [Nocardia goodfellowii]|uniref:Nonribosomal peptide synthetase DhbF n=1 Tax=Nocardia goodfellowii TaxID=882446 RepID=A0ABS4QC96_9NOCA|nr:non-ribosomal peptide synthetase [Nocardia goodfellowii]MBP2189329.1 nonribosomal peptide synthetase DhbF [Nocardia goodfellowii]